MKKKQKLYQPPKTNTQYYMKKYKINKYPETRANLTTSKETDMVNDKTVAKGLIPESKELVTAT